MKTTLWWRSIDKTLFFIIFGLILFGILLINVSTQSVALRIGVNYYNFINKQIIFVILGAALILMISTVRSDYLEKFCILGFCTFLLCLVAVNFFGFETKGAKRWLSIAGSSFQPSEFIKPFFIVINAMLLSKNHISFNRSRILIPNNKRFVISASLYLLISILLVLQPDFGMFILFSMIWFVQIFTAGISYALIWVFFGIGLSSVTLAYFFLSHVRYRIDMFIQKTEINYQVSKSLLAFKNGGLFGVGLGEGMVKRSLPDSHTDFIFAVAGEEFGAMFCIMILTFFVLMLIKLIAFCIRIEDRFVVLSVAGLSAQIFLQVFINIGVSLDLLPTKGMTLPLISYGGSSTLAICILFGLILNFSRSNILHSYKLKLKA